MQTTLEKHAKSPENLSYSYLGSLSDELILFILRLASPAPAELFNLMLISPHFREMVEDNSLWRRFYEEDISQGSKEPLFRISCENLKILSNCNKGVFTKVFKEELPIDSGINGLKTLYSIKSSLESLLLWRDIPFYFLSVREDITLFGEEVLKKIPLYKKNIESILSRWKIEERGLENLLPIPFTLMNGLNNWIDNFDQWSQDLNQSIPAALFLLRVLLAYDGISSLLGVAEKPFISISDILNKLELRVFLRALFSSYPVDSQQSLAFKSLIGEKELSSKSNLLEGFEEKIKLLTHSYFRNVRELFTDHYLQLLSDSKLVLFIDGIRSGLNQNLIPLSKIGNAMKFSLFSEICKKEGIGVLKKMDEKAIASLLEGSEITGNTFIKIIQQPDFLKYISFNCLMEIPPEKLNVLLQGPNLLLFQQNILEYKNDKILLRETETNLLDLDIFSLQYQLDRLKKEKSGGFLCFQQGTQLSTPFDRNPSLNGSLPNFFQPVRLQTLNNEEEKSKNNKTQESPSPSLSSLRFSNNQ